MSRAEAARSGPAAVLAWHRDRRAAFPDLRYEIIWSVNELFGVLQQLGVTVNPPPPSLSTME